MPLANNLLTSLLLAGFIIGGCASSVQNKPATVAAQAPCPALAAQAATLIPVPADTDRDPRNGRFACGWTGAIAVPGRTLHVRPDGNDASDGLSSATAFATLQKAADVTLPGDTVLVHSGTYQGERGGDAVLRIHRSGSEAAPIVFRAADGERPVLRNNAVQAIHVADASYVVVEGFELVGQAKQLSRELAMAHKTDRDRWDTNESGIYIWNAKTGGRSHHVIVRNNRIHDFGGDGIVGSECDCITVADNTVYACGFHTLWVGWGILFWQPRPLVQVPGYKMVIRGNRVFDIWSYVPYVNEADTTEPLGKAGIMVDLFTQHGYAGPTLIEGNLVFRNQGCGVQIYEGINVDVVNNTLFENMLGDRVDWGEYCDFRSHGSRVFNNVFVASKGHKTTFVRSTIPDAVIDNNLHWPADAPGDRRGPRDRVGDPRFVSVPAPPVSGHTSERGWDFHLGESSAAINGAMVEKAPLLDADGSPRPDDKPDLGAFERYAP